MSERLLTWEDLAPGDVVISRHPWMLLCEVDDEVFWTRLEDGHAQRCSSRSFRTTEQLFVPVIRADGSFRRGRDVPEMW